MKKIQLLIAAVMVLLSPALLAQTGPYDPSKDPRVYLRPYFDKYNVKADEDEVDCDENNFLRWLDHWYPRLAADGKPINSDAGKALFNHTRTAARSTSTILSHSWQSLGPSSTPWDRGIGRIECMAFNPLYNNIMYAGAAAGGFWITTDSGGHWITTTDAIASIGIDDIAVNPYHPDTIYAATGEKDLWDCVSVGVIKSVDGGYTWDTTGLTFTIAQNLQLARLLIDPDATSTIYAAEKNGSIGNVYKSTDAGKTWSIILTTTQEIYDMRMHPGNSHQIYVSTIKGLLLRTTDAGATWTDITSHVGFVGSEAITMAVSAAAPDNLYLMAEGNPSPSDMNCGVYVSKDGGATFTKMADNSIPSTVDWFGYAFAVSQLDPNLLYVAGSSVFQSNDCGATYSVVSNSIYGNYLHLDDHQIQFKGTEVFVACDGGLYKCMNLSGPYWTWTDISSNMVISELYDFSSAALSPHMFVMGMQDNGSGTVRGNGYFNEGLGSDGMTCIINPKDTNNIYESGQTGYVDMSHDGFATWSTFINSSITGEGGAWTTPFLMDNVDTNVLWAGYANIWKTRDQGVTWTSMSSFPSNWAGAPIKHISIGADTNIIYCSFEWSGGFWRTFDNGAHWTQITYPAGTAYGTSLDNFVIDSLHPEYIWATVIGLNGALKVFKSTDTGNTWTNISYNMPNILVSSLAHENNSPHRLFVGTEMGVYVLTDTTWQLYGLSLPNVDVRKLEIYYPLNVLRAGTYGRGVWQVSLDTAAAALVVSNVNNNSNAANQFTIFPNPAKGNITVTSTNGLNRIAIISLIGQELFNKQYNTRQATIDVSGLAPGIYLVRINNRDVQKFVKE